MFSPSSQLLCTPTLHASHPTSQQYHTQPSSAAAYLPPSYNMFHHTLRATAASIFAKRIHGQFRYVHQVPSTDLPINALAGKVENLQLDVATRFGKLEADVNTLNTRFGKLEVDVKDVGDKVDNLEHKVDNLEHSLRDQLAGYILKQEEGFTTFYLRCLFGVLGVSAVLVGASLIQPISESRRLDNEIKKRGIIQDGQNKIVKGEDKIVKGEASG